MSDVFDDQGREELDPSGHLHQRTLEEGSPFAFPFSTPETPDGTQYFCPGMQLRDWFAGQALAGLGGRSMSPARDIADAAYRIADAMLEARK